MKTKLLLLALIFGTLNSFSMAVPSPDQSKSGKGVESKEQKPGKIKPYPLKTCIVSDDDLGEMGKPVVFTYKGQEIKLCCKPCRKDFDKDPAKYLKKLEGKK